MKEAVTSAYAFAANTSVTQCSNSVTIKSSKSTTIPKLVIRDSVPVTTDPFKVILTSPAGLAKLEGDETVEEAPGTVARWRKDKADSWETGLMEWVITNFEAGEEKKVTLSYIVKSPLGVEWTHSPS